LIDESTLSLSRDRRRTIVGVVGFAVAMAAASQIAIPIPGTAVPMTLSPLAAILAGLWLGPRAGAASMVLYLAAGAAGLPVFAPMGAPGMLRLIGPTGGYLLAFPIAAFAAGAVARRYPSFLGRVAAAALGFALIHIGGIAQLTILTGSVVSAVIAGSLPFLAMDLVKVLLAGVLSRGRTDSARA
jgi:biotin transport system substrate-specific component